jgi:hypothetical protein
MYKSLVAVIAASAAVSGCNVHDNDGGATVSRNYQVGNFQQIEVAGPYQVEVRTGPAPSVSGQGPEKLLERITVEVQGDKLLIHSEQHNGWLNFGWSHHGTARFTVTVPQLSAATLAGSGAVHVDQARGQGFTGTLAGSGSLGIDNVDVQSLKLVLTGSGDIKAGPGKAQSAEYVVAGSGRVDAGGVQAQQAKVSLAGSGNLRGNASGPADVSLMGSGDVDLAGGAKCTISRAGSGSVHCS